MATTKKHEAEPVKDEPKAAAPDAGLIVMVKGGESLAVHPSCVKAHEGAGWKVAP